VLIVPSKSYPRIVSFTEDEVSTTVFGPLCFMASSAAWQALVVAGLIERGTWASLPTSHVIEFWFPYPNPDRSADATWKHTFPDIVFKFNFENGNRVCLILEVKWDANQSSHDENRNGTQLAQQWLAVLAAVDPKTDTRQIYLTKHRSKARSALEETKRAKLAHFDREKWASALPKAMTWSDLSSNVKNCNDDVPHEVIMWADSVSAFLTIRNVVSFGGFKRVTCAKTSAFAYRFRAPSFRWPRVSNPNSYNFKR
jgi:hypothetical protein